jgi:hypothetical protein
MQRDEYDVGHVVYFASFAKPNDEKSAAETIWHPRKPMAMFPASPSI